MSHDTARPAKRENPSRRVTQGILVAASPCPAGGLFQLSESLHDARQAILGAVVAIVSLAASWLALHTMLVLRYAALY